MSVAESTVILAPMSQLGCVEAFFLTHSGSSRQRRRSSCGSMSRNAPPDAVRMTRLRPPGGTPCSDWKMAECSESAGVILTPYFLRSGRMTGPPEMSVSLFASAISLPASIAATVGSSPAHPTMPVTTTSESPYLATSISPCSPQTSSGIFPPHPESASRSSSSALGVPTETILGLYLRICSLSSFTLFPAASPSTSKRSGR
mmetsp:Transcript_55482/g.131754  ORF Transcript_55482/g.131754 Transcript_55482/m.131754 type:complete len:202 (+) Transcript_55482:590-1195(+)